MKTRGQVFLESHGIVFRTHWYDHQQKGAAFAAESTGIPLQNMIKTLVISEGSGSEYAFVLMPGDRELNLKSAATALNWRKARMATQQEAERLTGYRVGGISPFGATCSLPVLIHDGWRSRSWVGINGGARGCIVVLAVDDLVRLIQSVPANLARSS